MNDEKPGKPTTRGSRSARKTTQSTEASSASATSPRTEEPAIPVERASELSPGPQGEDLEAEIRRRAYEIYLSRGGQEGDHVADWLEAERMVRGSQRGNQRRDSDAFAP
ncbi:MAG TPA: DUF2934 domain-containing protein [Gemmatimonadaceae bacterium]